MKADVEVSAEWKRIVEAISQPPPSPASSAGELVDGQYRPVVNISTLWPKKSERKPRRFSKYASRPQTRPSQTYLAPTGKNMLTCIEIRSSRASAPLHGFSTLRNTAPNNITRPLSVFTDRAQRRLNGSGLRASKPPGANSACGYPKAASVCPQASGFLNDLSQSEPWCSAKSGTEVGDWVIGSFEVLERTLMSIANAGIRDAYARSL